MLEFDFTNVCHDVIGSEHGLNIDFEFSNYSQKISDIITNIYKEKDNFSTNYPWISRYRDNVLLEEIQEYAESVKGKFDNIIVIGHGSAINGIKAIAAALLLPYWNTVNSETRNGYPLIHFLTNIDPDNINQLVSVRNLKKCLMMILSKNGTEPEVMSLFMLAKRRLEEEIGSDYREHLITCTSKGSLLYQIAHQEGYRCFEFPQENVGSFSILTPCGLLPLTLTGVNVDELLSGTRDMIEECRNPDIYKNPIAQTALLHYLSFIQKQKIISVIMSYSTRLQEIPSWCSQFKSECLLKDYDNSGRYVSVGQTPYNVHGCNDQHALLQTFLEGPNNKIINILKIGKFDTDNLIPNFFDYTSLRYLCGKNLSTLMDAEIEAMKMILTDYQRPNITVTIPKLTPYYVGQFIGLYLMNIAFQAALYNVNPYTKSGAENFQNYIYAQMGQTGYEETLREMKEKLEKTKRPLVLPE